MRLALAERATVAWSASATSSIVGVAPEIGLCASFCSAVVIAFGWVVGLLESMLTATIVGRFGVHDKPAASTTFWRTERAP